MFIVLFYTNTDCQSCSEDNALYILLCNFILWNLVRCGRGRCLRNSSCVPVLLGAIIVFHLFLYHFNCSYNKVIYIFILFNLVLILIFFFLEALIMPKSPSLFEILELATLVLYAWQRNMAHCNLSSICVSF